MIKGPIQEKDVTHAPKIGVPIYIKQILTDIKRKTESNTIIAGNFDIPLRSMERSPRQETTKKILDLNYTSDQADLKDKKIFKCL